MHNDGGCGAEVGDGRAHISNMDQQLIGAGLLWPWGPQHGVIVHQGGPLESKSALAIP